jgi:hypothetical protein
VIVLAVLALAAAAVLGFAIGRWPAVVLAAAAWPLYVLGRKAEWWGNGVGEGWQVALVVGAVLAFVGAVAGVLARRALWPGGGPGARGRTAATMRPRRGG